MPKTAGARETERKSCRGDKYDDIISLCLHREFFYFIGFYLYSSYRHKIYKEVKKWQKLN